MTLTTTPSRTTLIALTLAGAAAIAAYAVTRSRHRSRDVHREEGLDAALADTFPASDALPPQPFPAARSDA